MNNTRMKLGRLRRNRKEERRSERGENRHWEDKPNTANRPSASPTKTHQPACANNQPSPLPRAGMAAEESDDQKQPSVHLAGAARACWREAGQGLCLRAALPVTSIFICCLSFAQRRQASLAKEAAADHGELPRSSKPKQKAKRIPEKTSKQGRKETGNAAHHFHPRTRKKKVQTA